MPAAETDLDLGKPQVPTAEYLQLLELTTNYMVAAEAMIDALQGKLETSTRTPDARERAAREIKEKITTYTAARRALIAYAQEREALGG